MDWVPQGSEIGLPIDVIQHPGGHLREFARIPTETLKRPHGGSEQGSELGLPGLMSYNIPADTA
jgi:hypothetical protein